MIKHNDKSYFDDRLYVLYLCRSTSKTEPDGTVSTTIYHEDSPVGSDWCIVTYHNVEGYPALKIDAFHSQEEAEAYFRNVEPSTPLISLGGRSPAQPLSYKAFNTWKTENGCVEYDYRRVFTSSGSNPREVICHRSK